MDFKEKFAFSLKNAERILGLMKNTHRQRISEREEEVENTFESLDDLTLPVLPPVRTVAERLQHEFFTKTISEYDEHLTLLQENQKAALKTLEKLSERYRQMSDYQAHTSRLTKTNQALDQEISAWERQEEDVVRAIAEEECSQMRLFQRVQKDLRSVVDLECSQNWQFSGLTNRWNEYLRELCQMPEVVSGQETGFRLALLRQPSIQQGVLNLDPPKTLKRSDHDQILGDLKDFSKNLKIPARKLS